MSASVSERLRTVKLPGRKCRKCGHAWRPRQGTLEECPKCESTKTYDATISIEGLKCERCGHGWKPQTATTHVTVCPECKSPWWNKPRKK
jgi:predicted Zn-ribbon and HTH transcriptional regulator